jgi:hypothetical protein
MGGIQKQMESAPSLPEGFVKGVRFPGIVNGRGQKAGMEQNWGYHAKDTEEVSSEEMKSLINSDKRYLLFAFKSTTRFRKAKASLKIHPFIYLETPCLNSTS